MRYKRSTILATVVATILVSSLASPEALAQTSATEDREFVGYDPGRCVAATRMIDGLNRHDYRDSTVFDPARDSLFTATVERIKACDEAYGGTTDDPIQRLNLARVKLFTDQDAEAAEVIRRHMTAMADLSDEEKAWELNLIVSDYLAGKPARLEEAAEAVAELDALGEAAAGMRLLAHTAMMRSAVMRHDDDEMRKEAGAAIEAWHELDEDAQLWHASTLASALVRRANVEALIGDGDGALAVIDSAHGLIPQQARQARTIIGRAQMLYSNIAKDAVPLNAEYWYNIHHLGSDEVPAPGRVTLVLPISRECVGPCLSILAAIRRVKEKFQDDGLDIVFRLTTAGYYLDEAPIDPVEEAERLSDHLLNDAQLPGALAVIETKYSWRSDGRRRNEPPAYARAYPVASLILFDRNGVVRYVADRGGWDLLLETRITRLIEQLIEEEPATTT